MSACNACNDDPKSIGARQPIRDNAGFVGGRPTTGIRFEKFGIDHRRAVPPHFVSIRPRERRPVARNSPRLLFCPDPGPRPRPDGRRRGEEKAGGAADTAGEEKNWDPHGLIRGLADADIHIACRPRHIYWHLYTPPLKHCSFGASRFPTNE